MKRKAVSAKLRHKWKTKVFVIVLLLVCLCFSTLWLMEAHYTRIASSSSSSSRFSLFDRKPKIAFLFIARNRLPLDLVWHQFFEGGNSNYFSIYVNNSIQIYWGEASMIQAEIILLQHALMDPSNERFAFLSDSCIPLYNFTYTYDYIMSTSTSFVDSFADTKEGRYNPKMDPVIPAKHWRKGSQWVILTRKHADIIVKDDVVFPMFQQHCQASGTIQLRKSLPEFWRDRPVPADNSKEHNCIPDEHYVATLLAQKGLEGELTRRSLTHTSWDISSSKGRERQGWHPVTYKLADATPMLVQSIKDIDNIYYETEYRREWCTSKGK
ncbi:hypothetical protein M8C21_017954, partial [Ambrosia artemisiifolia]